MAQDAIEIGRRTANNILQMRSAAPATSGYLAAIGDSWFDYPFHDVIKLLEDEHGYNIESTAHLGAPIEQIAFDKTGQLYNFSRCLEKIQAHGVGNW